MQTVGPFGAFSNPAAGWVLAYAALYGLSPAGALFQPPTGQSGFTPPGMLHTASFNFPLYFPLCAR